MTDLIVHLFDDGLIFVRLGQILKLTRFNEIPTAYSASIPVLSAGIRPAIHHPRKYSARKRQYTVSQRNGFAD